MTCDCTTYTPHGCTALYDAVGEAIERTELRVSCCRDNPRVVLAVMTDGLENASSSYDAPKVRRMLERVKSNGWETFFLGSDMRSLREAETIGFDAERATRFAIAPAQVLQSMRTVHSKVQRMSVGECGSELDFKPEERKMLAGEAE